MLCFSIFLHTFQFFAFRSQRASSLTSFLISLHFCDNLCFDSAFMNDLEMYFHLVSLDLRPEMAAGRRTSAGISIASPNRCCVKVSDFATHFRSTLFIPFRGSDWIDQYIMQRRRQIVACIHNHKFQTLNSLHVRSSRCACVCLVRSNAESGRLSLAWQLDARRSSARWRCEPNVE